MKVVLGIAVLGSLGLAAIAAQAQGLPPGPYLRQCRDIQMKGQFLHAWCQGRYGSGNSSINVQSCSAGIGVDPNGGLICGGSGSSAPNPYPQQPYPPNTRPWPPQGGGDGGYYPPGGGGYDRYSVTIYDQFAYRGRSMRLDGEMPNLGGTRFNDRVTSIKLRKRSGPWLACEDANYRGRCITVSSNTRDVGALGMLNRISSMRPLYDDARPQPR